MENVCYYNHYKQEALQIAEKRETKGKGEKERYNQLTAESQRIPKRDKNGFLSEQCKEKGENHRMGMTRDVFKKIRDAQGMFHSKKGTIKDISVMDLTEAEEIKK